METTTKEKGSGFTGMLRRSFTSTKKPVLPKSLDTSTNSLPANHVTNELDGSVSTDKIDDSAFSDMASTDDTVEARRKGSFSKFMRYMSYKKDPDASGKDAGSELDSTESAAGDEVAAPPKVTSPARRSFSLFGTKKPFEAAPLPEKKDFLETKMSAKELEDSGADAKQSLERIAASQKKADESITNLRNLVASSKDASTDNTSCSKVIDAAKENFTGN